MSKYTFFWGGPFSQWYKSPFNIEGIEYNCCEQYMMAQKALLFEDDYHYDKIMSTSNPKKQKAFGRKVENFNAEKWNDVCRDIVFDANMAKFTQNDTLRDILLETGETELVEASPYDKIWGIGLGESDPRCLDKTKWQGKNWLGIAITEVREMIKHGVI